MREDVFFRSGANQLDFPVVVITGACRSGKTLLGNLLATCPEVEYAEEPWPARTLLMAVSSRKMEREFASSMFSTYLFELYCDLILLREANFRRQDLSSIWTKKTPEEIDWRLNNLNVRNDVLAFLKNKNPTLLVNLPECALFADFIFASLIQVQIIHVVRNSFDVAWDVSEKKWFSNEQLLSPLHANLYSAKTLAGQTWYIPWWVDEGEEESFVKLSDYERGLYYWCSLVETGLEAFQACGSREIMVCYEDLVADPDREFNRVISCLGFSRGKLTGQMIGRVKKPDGKEKPSQKINNSVLDRIEKINQKIGTLCEHPR
ncbi:sulfotransferase [Nitrospina watsonii]|uniref:Sulfotransferase domain-containing protein n=1 Tax=Nitrospina watsonii TaxID=1323948 RepID=A0ABM9HA63_9BACT|nr:sulfotransferase [Nitrospina watsonii]CAI2717019.1 conserved protein of unknown function [Nitrospina watsonii]